MAEHRYSPASTSSAFRMVSDGVAGELPLYLVTIVDAVMFIEDVKVVFVQYTRVTSGLAVTLHSKVIGFPASTLYDG